MDKYIFKNDSDLFVTGEIGYDFEAEYFMQHLASFSKDETINVHIYSGGGAVFDALAIYDFVKVKGIKFNAFISGLSGSAATIIGAAAERTEIGANSFYFVHRAFNAGGDNSPEVNRTLNAINERIIDIYKNLTGLSKPRIKQLLDAGDNGALLTSKEAIELGFANAMFKEAQLAASVDWHKEHVINNNLNSMDNSINVDELKTGLFNDVKEFVNNLFTEKEKTVSEEALENAVKAELDTRFSDIVANYEEKLTSFEAEKEGFENKINELESELTAFKAGSINDGAAGEEPTPNAEPKTVSEWDSIAANLKDTIKF
jgi:ATP-dependent protease ClpP protease subunit